MFVAFDASDSTPCEDLDKMADGFSLLGIFMYINLKLFYSVKLKSIFWGFPATHYNGISKLY